MRQFSVLAALALSTGAVCAEPSVERGAYLVTGPMGCGNCHTPQGPDGPLPGMTLAGMVVEDGPPFTAIANNLTPAARIADWSDAELGRAIRECLRPDGSLIGPPMPCALYRHIGDDDLASVVLYLRTVAAVDHDPGTSEYRIPLPPAYGPPIDSVTPPPPDVTVEYGEYVANIAHCMECHSAVGEMGAPSLDAAHFGAGGFQFHGPWGVSVAPNITPSADGIADYSDAELKTMIVAGKRPDGSPMMPPMPYPYLARMTADDLDAVVLYLRTVPALPDPG